MRDPRPAEADSAETKGGDERISITGWAVHLTHACSANASWPCTRYSRPMYSAASLSLAAELAMTSWNMLAQCPGTPCLRDKIAICNCPLRVG
ncbi:hypothetical protein N7509_012099 [Penicillium cosmopolitanum]|uniref:Uncharacterized protein n=1 Tax=Penicillium cosmopolitanum TaxID=1131564 RepID=A0A9W9SIF1_9EURO|nr:uncharacterized protein N7509_012099 [Penicillium cosmopolitanum]KAJ5378980.1 hypothetical protein N7509_012099 [Penicillium cosmopolitanum]